MEKKFMVVMVILSVSLFVFVKNLNNGFIHSDFKLDFAEKISQNILIPKTENNFGFYRYNFYTPEGLMTTTSGISFGLASWYNYKRGLYAASVHFEKGTRLRVTNLDNGKYVDVLVDDYGPNRIKHPNRIIDLDKVAFRQIAYLTTGLVRVKINQLN